MRTPTDFRFSYPMAHPKRKKCYALILEQTDMSGNRVNAVGIFTGNMQFTQASSQSRIIFQIGRDNVITTVYTSMSHSSAFPASLLKYLMSPKHTDVGHLHRLNKSHISSVLAATSSIDLHEIFSLRGRNVEQAIMRQKCICPLRRMSH